VVSAGKGVVTRVGRHALSSRGEGWAGVRLPLRLHTREEVKLVIHVSSLVLVWSSAIIYIYARSYDIRLYDRHAMTPSDFSNISELNYNLM
jgi:hypothetical protein